MSEDDKVRWDGRHGMVDTGGPMPPDALRGREDLLPVAGRALDVACGRGQVAVWLALRGRDVDAVDVSAVGLRAGAALAAEHGVSGRVRWREVDLDAGLPPGRYDLIVCQRFRDPALYPSLTRALRPGGLLVLTVLSEVGDDGGRFRAAPGELHTAFGALTVLHHDERNGEATLVARR